MSDVKELQAKEQLGILLQRNPHLRGVVSGETTYLEKLSLLREYVYKEYQEGTVEKHKKEVEAKKELADICSKREDVKEYISILNCKDDPLRTLQRVRKYVASGNKAKKKVKKSKTKVVFVRTKKKRAPERLFFPDWLYLSRLKIEDSWNEKIKNREDRSGLFYCIEMRGRGGKEEFLKVGITSCNTVGQRYRNFDTYKYKILFTKKFPNGLLFYIETIMLYYLYDCHFEYIPKYKFSGVSECFVKHSLDKIEQVWRDHILGKGGGDIIDYCETLEKNRK